MEIERLASRKRPTHLRGQRQHDSRRGRSQRWLPRQPKAKRAYLAWGCRDGTGGCRGEYEGVSNDDIILSANEHKRSGISHGGNARRRRFGDDKRRFGCCA